MQQYPYPTLKKLIARENWQDLVVSTEAIEAMERQLGVHFPASVKEMMRLLGKDWDDLLRNGGGLLQCLQTMPHIQEVSRKILAEMEVFLPFDWVAIVEYSEVFLFVRLDEGDDPPLYRFYIEDAIVDKAIPSEEFKSPYPKGVRLGDESFHHHVERLAQERLDLLDELDNRKKK
jgi:hypothetical protein